MNKLCKKQSIILILLACCSVLLLPELLFAQIHPAFKTLTRGKFWANVSDIGFEVHENVGPYSINYAYPGSYESNNMVWGGLPLDAYLVRTDDGQEHRIFNQGWSPTAWISSYLHQLVKNYNFVNDPNMPEEYTIGRSHSYDSDPSDDQFPLLYEKEYRRFVWSLPDYDDFIIHMMVLKNIDTRAWTEAYFGLWKPVCLTRGGHSRFKYDQEYTWEEDLETLGDENGAFVFYDETSWPGHGTTPATYTISPGDVTGDKGDPGNIKEANSVDRRLYSPQVITEAWVECTPNKNGEQKFWYEIRNSGTGDWMNWSHSNAPKEEQMRWFQGTYADYVDVLTAGQPRMDYKEAQALSLPDAGNTWERHPIYARIIGPYDIAPGDSITATWFTVGGDMDRSISMKGGLEATQQLPDASITDLKKNWAAAMKIYKAAKANGFTNWNEAIDTYPPPTPGSAPRVDNDDELVVETFASAEEGSGYILKWIPVPDDYQDPLKGANDFEGYKVYKSEIGYEGPWELLTDIKKADAQIVDGRIVYKFNSKPGIPQRFLVTAYDTDGNESGTTCWNYWAVSAPYPPSNDLSQVLVVPSPFKQISGFLDAREDKRLSFVNVPSKCTVRIYTVAGELVQTLEHDEFGEKAWGSVVGNDYMLTKFAMNVAPGVYFYHIESHVKGHEGETATGKFAIIK